MKILRIRDVKLPERGTKDSSGIDLFIPNDIAELYNCETCRYTPTAFISEEEQKNLKMNHFRIEDEKPFIEIPA